MSLPSSNITQAWQKDWRSFWLHIQSEVLAGESLSTIGKRYAGTTVEWSGLLVELDLDPEYPSATMLMPDLQISLPSTEIARVWGLAVPIKLKTQAEWQPYSPGIRMTFSASIVPSWNPFGSFSDFEGEDGSRLITVRVTDGQPVSSK